MSSKGRESTPIKEEHILHHVLGARVEARAGQKIEQLIFNTFSSQMSLGLYFQSRNVHSVFGATKQGHRFSSILRIHADLEF